MLRSTTTVRACRLLGLLLGVIACLATLPKALADEVGAAPECPDVLALESRSSELQALLDTERARCSRIEANENAHSETATDLGNALEIEKRARKTDLEELKKTRAELDHNKNEAEKVKADYSNEVEKVMIDSARAVEEAKHLVAASKEKEEKATLFAEEARKETETAISDAVMAKADFVEEVKNVKADSARVIVDAKKLVAVARAKEEEAMMIAEQAKKDAEAVTSDAVTAKADLVKAVEKLKMECARAAEEGKESALANMREEAGKEISLLKAKIHELDIQRDEVTAMNKELMADKEKLIETSEKFKADADRADTVAALQNQECDANAKVNQETMAQYLSEIEKMKIVISDTDVKHLKALEEANSSIQLLTVEVQKAQAVLAERDHSCTKEKSDIEWILKKKEEEAERMKIRKEKSIKDLDEKVEKIKKSERSLKDNLKNLNEVSDQNEIKELRGCKWI